MIVDGVDTGMRRRPRHALGNDASISQAAIEAFSLDGFDATSMASLSARAHLTYGAAYARFEDKSELAVALWDERLFTAVTDALDSAAAAIPSGGDAFARAMATFVRPGPDLLAAVELIQASRFEPALEQGIHRPFANWLTQWIGPGESISPTEAVVRSTVANLALGLVMVAGRPWQVDLTAELRRIGRVLASPGPATELPADRAAHLDDWPFASGDPRIDRALAAIATIVGEIGYHRATITRICRAAKVSTGLLYGRYPGKLDLFLAANDALLANGYAANASFTQRLASAYGSGIAEAVVWREFQRPAYAIKRSLALESNRLARFDEQMRRVHLEKEQVLVDQYSASPDPTTALAYLHWDMAMAMGVNLVPNLVPAVWTLPFDVVTVPLLAGPSAGSAS